MFGGGKQASNGKAPASTSSSPSGPSGLNTLVKGTHVEGSIKAPSDIRIEGTLEGNLDCQAKLIIGPSGNVNGNVNCRTAMIEGRFDGTLVVSELLEVRESAKVEGEITYGKLKIDAGAVLLGTIRMSNGPGGQAGASAKAAGPKAKAHA